MKRVVVGGAEGVEVVPHRVVEEHRVLRDDCQPRAELREVEARDVDAVDLDRAEPTPVRAPLRLDEAPTVRRGERGYGTGAAARPPSGARRELSIGIYLDNYASGWRVEDNAVLGAMSDRVCADRRPRISLARGYSSQNI